MMMIITSNNDDNGNHDDRDIWYSQVGVKSVTQEVRTTPSSRPGYHQSVKNSARKNSRNHLVNIRKYYTITTHILF
jgi:hypothetical protein